MARVRISAWPDARPFVRGLEAVPDSSGCVADLVASQAWLNAPEQNLTNSRRAVSAGPVWWSHWSSYAAQLTTMGRREEAVAVLLDGLRHTAHAVHLLALQLQLVEVKQQMGDSAGAAKLLAAIGTSVARDGRPWLRWTRLGRLSTEAERAGNDARLDSLTREQVKTARKAGAAVAEYQSVIGWGSVLAFRRNDPKGAIAPLTRAIQLAEAIGSPRFILDAYHSRGRAFNTLGDFRRAELDLRKALTVVARDDWTMLAEVHHNLAHTFEGLGRWANAAREADLYRRSAWRVREGSAAFMMSLHDVGSIQWKAGQHAAARTAFEEMVQVVEELGAHHFYAGEYYERIGDLARAASYYDRGARSKSTGDLQLNLAGLTRMYQALGLTDSARVAATRHDQPGMFGVSRLLPSILLADGQVDAGLRLARADVAEWEAKGSRHLEASARLQLARLLLDAGRAADADGEAARAERLAASANLIAEVIEAIHLRGVAQLRAGSRSSIATLLLARSHVRAHPVAAAELQVETALGDAFAAFGPDAASLSAYNRAATASQRVTSSYASALDRARNRDQRVAPFDGALRVLAAMPASASRSAQMFSWSARRKDAIWSENVAESGVADVARGLAGVQGFLDDRSALVDYFAVDSIVWALVITRRDARAIRLPMTVSATAALVQRLRRPLVAVDAGQLDLARAPFDLPLAHQLYLGLFRPLEEVFGDAREIVIVPDGPLHGVPFSALPMSLGARRDDYHSATYVVDRYAVTLATTPALGGSRRSRILPADVRVLVANGAVPGGEEEVAAIVDAWSARRVTVLSGAGATEAALRKRAAASGVLHFAVHARAHEADPLASYLELARDDMDDGLLHVTEIAALKFRGDLVVLTGCETMPGPAFAGTGPFGIANSFLAAGARTVIAALWPVGASAAELGHELHRALADGAEPRRAFRSAQLKLRRNPARAHPFYWGGYSLVVGSAP